MAEYIRVALPVANIQEQLAWFDRAVWTVAAVTALAAMLLALWLSLASRTSLNRRRP